MRIRSQERARGPSRTGGCAIAACRSRPKRRTRSISRRSPSSGRSGSRSCSRASRCRSPRRCAFGRPTLAAALVAYDVAAAVDFHWELAGVTVPAVLIGATAVVHASRRGRDVPRAVTVPVFATAHRRGAPRLRGCRASRRRQRTRCARATASARGRATRARRCATRRFPRPRGESSETPSRALPPTGARSSSTATTGACGSVSRTYPRESRAASLCARRRDSIRSLSGR